ncbi:hypothetical protein MKX01_029672 [Papaver californicum]|nr:hypothetical protein MKX01_029672 [Papaver californicum]
MTHYSRLHDDDATTNEEMVADGKLENCKTCAVLNAYRWFYYNDQKTCPLCRTSLLFPIMSMPLTTYATAGKSEPSWAVERILYLFREDLLLREMLETNMINIL